jgi:hypothetical protein
MNMLYEIDSNSLAKNKIERCLPWLYCVDDTECSVLLAN